MTTLYLCGAGNSEGVRLAQVIQRASARWRRIVVLDDDPAKHGQTLLGVEILGPLTLLAHCDPKRSEVANLVARTTQRRAAVRAKLENYGLRFATLIHPTVDTSWADVGPDTVIYEQAVVSPETKLGESSVVFMRGVIGHEARIGKCCVIAAGAVLNARVVLGDGVYVGSNASILPEICIGAGATIGANTVVIQDVPADTTVVGVPGQIVSARSTALSPASRVPRDSQLTQQALEESIAAVWRHVLRREHVSATVNFFDMGGSSLLALQIIESLRQKLGVIVGITAVFQFPTVRSLAEHLGVRAAPTGAIEPAWSGRARGEMRRNRSVRPQLFG
ncbi:MAG: phosphopantetheine-binding protein [Planctomycetota bacterium]